MALGTAQGIVKRVTTDYPKADAWEAIALKAKDRVVGAVELHSADEDLVFVTSEAQLLRFPASAVRPQGRAAGGMAGIRLGTKDAVMFFGAVDPGTEAVVVTISGSSGALPGTHPGSWKVSPYAGYPAKGRATGGVRAHRFLKGEDGLVAAWVASLPVRAATAAGVAVELPAADERRDGSGTPATQVIAAVTGPVR